MRSPRPRHQPAAEFTYQVPAIAEPGTRIWLKVNPSQFANTLDWYEATLE